MKKLIYLFGAPFSFSYLMAHTKGTGGKLKWTFDIPFLELFIPGKWHSGRSELKSLKVILGLATSTLAASGKMSERTSCRVFERRAELNLSAHHMDFLRVISWMFFEENCQVGLAGCVRSDIFPEFWRPKSKSLMSGFWSAELSWVWASSWAPEDILLLRRLFTEI